MAEVIIENINDGIPEVTVAIPCYERSDCLQVCINSIKKTCNAPLKLIVYVERQSVSLNRKSLLELIDTPFILWCDDDVIFEDNDWYNRFMKLLNDDLSIGVITCQINDFQGRKVPMQPNGYVWASSGTVMFCRNNADIIPDVGYIKALWEDIDLQVQYRIKGYRVYCDNTLTVLHMNMGRNPAMSENQAYFNAKWGWRLQSIPV